MLIDKPAHTKSVKFLEKCPWSFDNIYCLFKNSLWFQKKTCIFILEKQRKQMIGFGIFCWKFCYFGLYLTVGLFLWFYCANFNKSLNQFEVSNISKFVNNRYYKWRIFCKLHLCFLFSHVCASRQIKWNYFGVFLLLKF